MLHCKWVEITQEERNVFLVVLYVMTQRNKEKQRKCDWVGIETLYEAVRAVVTLKTAAEMVALDMHVSSMFKFGLYDG